MSRDTIFALSSGSGVAGLAVVRISGPASAEVLQSLTRKPLPSPRYAMLCSLYEPGDGETLDEGLVLWFPAPASFTGEDVVELHLHGGRATVEAVCAVLGGFELCRFAEPGEFSRRAFENKKLDLTEIEGLADLIAAETEAQRKQALKQLSGGIGEIYEAWREELLRLLAYAEAAIDFAEEDLPENLLVEVKHKMLGISDNIIHYIGDNRRGERLRDGFQIAIAGPPNAGKSSLLNELAQRDVAIVSEQAGTTRDIIEVRLDLGGFSVTIADTAGIRSTSDAIEAEGVRRAKNRAELADLTIYVFDASLINKDDQVLGTVKHDDVVVFNKVDLLQEDSVLPDLGEVFAISTSVKTGYQIDFLINHLTAKVGEALTATAGLPPLTRLRHREALQDCQRSLVRAMEASEAELMTEDLRLATRSLGRITGRVDVEEVLDLIFSEFCIGK